jgi:predicted nucleic acid-binding protein
MADDTPVFLDTSLIIAATVEAHPSHAVAAAYVDNVVAEGRALHMSAQICREFLVVLTRQPVSGRLFTVEDAHQALSVWMTGCTVLEEGEAVLSECLALTKRFEVRGKQVHTATSSRQCGCTESIRWRRGIRPISSDTRISSRWLP